jgi:hypothetical protein
MAWQSQEPALVLYLHLHLRLSSEAGTSPKVYNSTPASFVSQARINRLSGLETVKVCRVGEVIDPRTRETIAGFVEEECPNAVEVLSTVISSCK